MTDSTSSFPSRRGSCFIDAAAARDALAMTLPMMEPLVRQPRICGAGFLYIVVMDPGLPPGSASFDEAVLLEHAIGDRDRWDADYAAFARGKAQLSWRYGCDGVRLQAERPHLLHAGDSLLGGSVHLDGITVAVSGAFQWFDEAFALALAGTLRAIGKERHAASLAAGTLQAQPATT